MIKFSEVPSAGFFSSVNWPLNCSIHR